MNKGAANNELSLFARILLLSYLIIACSTTPPSSIDSQLVHQTGYEQIKDQLRIYVHPLRDRKETIRYFGASLLDKGILPVFILVENKNTSRHFLVEPVGPDLADSKGEAKRKAGNSKVQGASCISSKDAKDIVYKTHGGRFWVVTGPVIWLAVFPLAVMSDFDYGPTDSAKSLQQALILKSFRKQTLTPGRTERGFLYYHLPLDNSLSTPIGISIKATDVETREVMYFRFTIQLKSRDKNGKHQ